MWVDGRVVAAGGNLNPFVERFVFQNVISHGLELAGVPVLQLHAAAAGGLIDPGLDLNAENVEVGFGDVGVDGQFHFVQIGQPRAEAGSDAEDIIIDIVEIKDIAFEHLTGGDVEIRQTRGGVRIAESV